MGWCAQFCCHLLLWDFRRHPELSVAVKIYSRCSVYFFQTSCLTEHQFVLVVPCVEVTFSQCRQHKLGSLMWFWRLSVETRIPSKYIRQSSLRYLWKLVLWKTQIAFEHFWESSSPCENWNFLTFLLNAAFIGNKRYSRFDKSLF